MMCIELIGESHVRQPKLQGATLRAAAAATNEGHFERSGLAAKRKRVVVADCVRAANERGRRRGSCNAEHIITELSPGDIVHSDKLAAVTHDLIASQNILHTNLTQLNNENPRMNELRDHKTEERLTSSYPFVAYNQHTSAFG